MAKKKTTTPKPADKKPAKKPAAKKETPPPKKAEPQKKVNEPVGKFSVDELKEFHTKCENLTRDIRKRAAEMADAKAEAKYATENYNKATETLTSYITGFKELPLLSMNQQAKAPKEKVDWRATPIADLDIEEHLAKAFTAAKITTAGLLAKALETHGITVIKNVTPKQYKVIRDALDKVQPKDDAKKTAKKKAPAKKPTKKPAKKKVAAKPVKKAA